MAIAQNFADRDGFIWLDGALIPWRDAKIHVLTHTLHYGLGCFEGTRAYQTEQGAAIFRLQDHTDRLFRSAKILGMPMPFSKDVLNDAQREVVRVNNLESAYLRPMCFYGSEGMGLHAKGLQTHVMIAAWAWGSYLGEENQTKGISAKISTYTRHHVNTAMCRAKANGHYFNSMLATTEAERDGYDEAILLDHEGFIAEASSANIFVIQEGKLFTPELSSALDGITRRTVMQLAAEKGLSVAEKRLTRDDLYVADEVFLTGTAAEITPIRALDKQEIGNGGRGEITAMLQTEYMNAVRGKTAHQGWLTLV